MKRSVYNDVKAARELMYNESVIERLKNEPDDNKRAAILCNARKGAYDRIRATMR